MKRSKILCWLLSVFPLLFYCSGAVACSLPAGWSDEKEFDEANYVFRALVTKVEIDRKIESELNPNGLDMFFVRVHFDVRESLKGRIENDPYALTWNAYSGGCGVPMVVGLEYLVFLIPISGSELPLQEGADALGAISNFGTRALPQNSSLIDSEMTKI